MFSQSANNEGRQIFRQISADPDQISQNAASNQVLCCLLLFRQFLDASFGSQIDIQILYKDGKKLRS